MKNIPTLRATLYLLLSLLGMLIGSLFPTPISALIHLLLVLLALLIEKRTFDGEGVPRLSASALWRMPRLWLIFPVFAFFTLGANLLSARLTLALGGSLPDMTPTLPLFLGAVLIAPVAEELLFRGLLIRLFRPFGDASAILLSALLFALAHGSLFQMPYAFVAGLFLAFAATASGGILYPLLFHVFYNLLTFFGDKIPTLPLLWSLCGLAAFSLLLFLLGKHPKLTKGDVRPSVRELLPLLCYTVLMAVFALLNF